MHENSKAMFCIFCDMDANTALVNSSKTWIPSIDSLYTLKKTCCTTSSIFLHVSTTPHSFATFLLTREKAVQATQRHCEMKGP